MPKLHKDFHANISVGVSTEMHQNMIALAYLQGHKGMYARVVRNILEKGIGEVLEALTPHQKADFDEILQNVKLQEAHILENKKAQT